MTTPKAIFYGLMMIAIAILLRPTSADVPGWVAQAEVAGMGYYELKYDWDFKKAVKSIVEDCDISGYVDGEYLYSSDISC